jgi:LysM repeat protein
MGPSRGRSASVLSLDREGECSPLSPFIVANCLVMRIVVLTLGLALACSLGPSVAHGQAASDSTYTVKDGDTLYDIAREVGVSVRTLMQWNDLDDSAIQVGQTLRVRPPSQPESEEEPETNEAPSSTSENPDSSSRPDSTKPVAPNSPPPYGRHTTATGDTFVNLALRLGTTADTLYALNDSTTAPLSSGRTLRLPRRFAPPTHVVQPGETVYSIGGEYGVSARALKAENDITANALSPGQRLRIPGRTASEVPPPGQWAVPDSTGRVAVYPAAFAGRLTASGTAYDPDDLVVSHPSLPFDSVVMLSTKDPTNHTFARVVDRGPIEEGVLLDVSDAVAQTLSLDPDQSSSVALRVVWIANE